MLTYAFDLLYAIYEEEGYAPSEIPTLILTHNLYGTEIDQRAGSLAAFALTMKARAKQRTFLNKDVTPNICVLEPIAFTPQELDLLRPSHLPRAEADDFWNQFEHADTFGSLIRPDGDLTAPLRAHLETLETETLQSGPLLEEAQTVLRQAEYLAERYCVAVANPPYMGSKQMNPLLSQFMKRSYPDSKSDLFAAFIERVEQMVKPHGFMAQVTMQSWMFLSSYAKLRTRLFKESSIVSMLHMGNMVMRIAFGTSATVWEVEGDPHRPGKYTYVEVGDLMDGEPKTFPPCNARNATAGEDGYFTLRQSDFAVVPGSPAVYWLSEKMRESFKVGQRLDQVANLRQGLATADNNRFLRQWWEVSENRTAFGCTSREEADASGARWFPYNKGGDFRKWYGNQEHVVNWENDGKEIIDFKPRAVVRNPTTYFSPSVSWSKVSSGAPAFRAYPAGFIYDVAGTSIFSETEGLRAALLAFANSEVALRQLGAVAPTLNYEVGQVASLPVAKGLTRAPASVATGAAETAKSDWNSFETSWEFSGSPLVAEAATPSASS